MEELKPIVLDCSGRRLADARVIAKAENVAQILAIPEVDDCDAGMCMGKYYTDDRVSYKFMSWKRGSEV